MIQGYIFSLLFIAVLTITSYGQASTDRAILFMDRSKTLSLNGAIALAYNYRPNLKAFEHQIEAARWAAKTELTNYYPHISLQNNLHVAKGSRGINGITTLEGRQLIYQFGGPLERYQRALKQRDIIALQQQDTQNNIRNAVEHTFLNLWLLQKQRNVVYITLAAAKAVYHRSYQENSNELLNKSDWLAAKTLYAQTVSFVEQYHEDVYTNEKLLSFLLGEYCDFHLLCIKHKEQTASSQEVFLSWQPARTIRLRPLAMYQRLARKHRFDLQQQNLEIAVRQDTIDIVKQQNLPSISLIGSTTHNAQAPTGLKNQQSIGTSLDWKIFDGTLSNHQTRQAEADHLSQQLKRIQLEQQINVDVAQAYHRLKKSMSRLKARLPRIRQACNDYVLKKEQCAIGDVSQVTLQEATATWCGEYFLWLNDIVDVSLQERDLAFTCGYPSEWAL